MNDDSELSAVTVANASRPVCRRHQAFLCVYTRPFFAWQSLLRSTAWGRRGSAQLLLRSFSTTSSSKLSAIS